MIKFILHIYTAARDRNGNCYHACMVTRTADGARLVLRDIGGESNARGQAYRAGLESSDLYTVQEVLPIRQWNALVKGWPYLLEEEIRLFCMGARDGTHTTTGDRQEGHMTVKHTPGPWDRTNLTVHTKGTADQPALAIARVLEAGIETEAATSVNQATANARLIARAPEMAALLEDLEDVLDNYSDVNDGADGQPVANRAMRALRDVHALLAAIDGRPETTT